MIPMNMTTVYEGGIASRKRNRNRNRNEEEKESSIKMKRKAAEAAAAAAKKAPKKKIKKSLLVDDEREKKVLVVEEERGGEKKQRGSIINGGDSGDNVHESWSNVGGEKWEFEVLMGSSWDYYYDELWPPTSCYWSSSSCVVDEQMLWAGSIWFPFCKEIEEDELINEAVWEDDLWHIKHITEIPSIPPINKTSY
ncbi:hypothetical protein BVC80_1211g51 [Macleaya cordata]|uniref:Uncharacterized protein n=1 Tax=Macleaya cordata TaxID=56857 RepID=A0A200Q3F2_MACCD|nr:hypothetical protein BVC80_1211g51 [Macleaya cordata]